MFLKSNKAKQLLDFLVEKNLELNHQIKTCESVISIAKDKD
jgi:predicted flavoprotein YhiN